MAFIDYNLNNYCTRCELEFSKATGTKCPECNYQARTLPRNPKVFNEKQEEREKFNPNLDSQIWVNAYSLEQN